MFEDKGYVMARLREEVSARMPRAEEAAHLRMPPGVPVIDVLHTSLNSEGAAYEVTRFVMRADMSGLLYDAPVERTEPLPVASRCLPCSGVPASFGSP